MSDAQIKVLYGDSTASTLPPDILDITVRLVDCAVAVAGAYAQMIALDRQEQEGSEATDAILADLDAFQKHVDAGLTATVDELLQGELKQHGTEVVSTVLGMVNGWRSQYLGNLEAARGLIARRKAGLLGTMRAAIETFVLPLRQRSAERAVKRVLDGATYRDEMTCAVVSGFKLRMSVKDAEIEIPRKVRTLLGKGAKVQIGTKLSRIRKIEEPAVFALDDQVLLEAQVESHRAVAVMTKKVGAPQTIRLELAPVADGAAARGTRPDGEQAVIPETDGATVRALWESLQSEAERIVAGPAKLLAMTLDGDSVEAPRTLLAAVERVVEHYRPLISEIADRSPNVEELAIKHETADGKREEVWIKRAELGQRLATLPPEMLRRVGIPDLHTAGEVVPSTPPIPQRIADADAGAQSERIVLQPPPPPPAPPAGTPAPMGEAAEDISLLDLDMLVEEISAPAEPGEDDGCVEPPQVRSRPT